ncbi:class F sortase [Modestobacter sp. NPDC049651]|uniref:class F sortase n=1 Tax=unclassified Modestobacter TaxID=2643866 RepID=UPI0033DE2C83
MLAVAAGVVALVGDPRHQDRQAPAARAEVPPAPVVLAAAGSADPARPVRVTIPAIGVDSDLVDLGVDAGGALVPPTDFARAGWFAAGPVPGDVGPAVLAGHVDSYRGPAVFFRLDELRPGDRVTVERSDGRTVQFAVTRVARYAKDRFATDEVYGPTADPQLRLVTCGGAFDRSRRSYLDNVVVYARLAQ